MGSWIVYEVVCDESGTKLARQVVDVCDTEAVARRRAVQLTKDTEPLPGRPVTYAVEKEEKGDG